MIKKILIIFIVIFLTQTIIAKCKEEQININSASQKDLEKLQGIGPAYAQQIITLRPFKNLEELTKVNGIAEKRLEAIKNQGLACVEEEEEKEEINKEEEKIVEFEILEDKKEKSKLETIDLTPKNINSVENVFNSNKIKYVPFIFFCILLIVWIVLKLKPRKDGLE